jgi:hypothetical protein
MATDHDHENGEPRNPSVGYDKSDLGARGILIFFLVLAIFAVCVHLGVLGVYVGMTKIADKHEPDLSPLAPKTVASRPGVLTNTANVNLQKFPEPRLQDDDTGEMTSFLLKESAALTAPSWQDEQGNVHPPIEQAMKEVVSGLPVREGSQALMNYPGAGREYAAPSAALEDENPEAAK